jgi:2-polyprenyl-3-methyl-5-hydroxy-6-metoxy-1,4-benzoquinol methylase
MELLGKCPVCGSETSNLFLMAKDYFHTGESFSIVKCSGCGFRYTNPRPEPTELGKYYQSADYISHSDSRRGLFASVYQMVRKYTLNRKKVLIGKFISRGNLLDIGCATGQFLNFMAAEGWTTTGIEPDEKTRNRAISEYGLHVYPEEKLNELKESSFDVITMWHVLEHVAGLNQRMEQIKKLLKPGGIIIIAVPNCNSYDAEKYGQFWAGYDLPRHLYHFTKSDINRLAEKFEFTIVKIIPMKFDSYYVSLLSEKYLKGNMKWVPAFWNGFWSNVLGRGKRGYSSQIYVLKTK